MCFPTYGCKAQLGPYTHMFVSMIMIFIIFQPLAFLKHIAHRHIYIYIKTYEDKLMGSQGGPKGLMRQIGPYRTQWDSIGAMAHRFSFLVSHA